MANGNAGIRLSAVSFWKAERARVFYSSLQSRRAVLSTVKTEPLAVYADITGKTVSKCFEFWNQ